MSLNELAAEVHGIAVSKGFWDLKKCGNGTCYAETPRDPLAALMLVVTEVTEAAEEVRKGNLWPAYSYKSTPESRHALEGFDIQYNPDGDGKTYIVSRFSGNRTEATHDFWIQTGHAARPIGLPSELADIIIRTLDAAAAWGIDIEAAVREKIVYNAQREHMHGKKA